jgi:hypothetical protein
MELFQVLWDDQKKLFLEFKKDEEEKSIFLPKKIKYLNLQFEITRIVPQELLCNQQPFLISIKKIYHSIDYLSFTIDLDEFQSTDQLKIKIIKLTIYLRSGHKIEYTLTESFKLSDIWINEDCYEGYKVEDLTKAKVYKSRIMQKRVIKEIQRDYNDTSEKETLIIENNEIENIVDGNHLGSMIRENTQTLKIIAKELQNLTQAIKQVSFNIQSTSYLPPPPIVKNDGSAIQPLKKPPSRPILLEGEGSSAKMMVIREMKSIFQQNIEKNSEFNVRDLLKPMSEEELSNMLLDEEKLIKRQEEAIQNQIKRLKKQKQEPLQLETLKASD